jgi:predicted small lipoprotein YifL
MNNIRLIFCALIIIITVAISSCGQKSSLYLPNTDDKVTTESTDEATNEVNNEVSNENQK